jgi:hypothetical protein
MWVVACIIVVDVLNTILAHPYRFTRLVYGYGRDNDIFESVAFTILDNEWQRLIFRTLTMFPPFLLGEWWNISPSLTNTIFLFLLAGFLSDFGRAGPTPRSELG